MLATGCAIDEHGAMVIDPNRFIKNISDTYQAQTIKQEAERGDAGAQLVLGSYYASGRGVPRDFVEAAKWYRLSAEQGNATAQYRLGACYASGKGVEPDPAETVKWFSLSAEQGYMPAQFRLGLCYAVGRGTAPDRAEAAKWLHKAADQGSLGAQNALRRLESNGELDANQPENLTESGTGKATAEASDSATQNPPLTVDEIKTLSSSGVKAEAVIAQIKETNSKFSSQDLASAQQAKPAVDPEVIKCMAANLR
jgi:TPR repeat protein